MKALDPVWTEKPETAGRVRGRIESVLDWATARGYRRGENPARWRGHLENLLPKKTKIRRVEHPAALSYPEIAEFMAKLREQEGVAARALEFAVLTMARTGEVIGAAWKEINFADAVVDSPGRAHEGRQGTPRGVVRCGNGDPESPGLPLNQWCAHSLKFDLQTVTLPHSLLG